MSTGAVISDQTSSLVTMSIASGIHFIGDKLIFKFFFIFLLPVPNIALMLFIMSDDNDIER